MAAPSKNEFWKLRSKHGRDKLFATPELMWDAACEYFQWCVDNPLHSSELMKSGDQYGESLEVPVVRAFTLSGLCSYLSCSSSYFRVFKSTTAKDDEDFLTIIERIEDVIYRQQFEGAAAGLLNANIIARSLGLSDKKEITGKDGADLIKPVSMADVYAAKMARKEKESSA